MRSVHHRSTPQASRAGHAWERIDVALGGDQAFDSGSFGRVFPPQKLTRMHEELAGGLTSYEIACGCESLFLGETATCTCHGATLRKNLEHGAAQLYASERAAEAEAQPPAATGAPSAPVLFWNETEKFGEFSNWYPCDIEFTIQGQTHLYGSAEQLFMAHKADLFGDLVALKKLQARRLSAAACKKIGQEVTNFDETRWDAAKRGIMLDVLTAKFEQHPKLAHVLDSTGESTLVEASPRDKVWGAGMGAKEIERGGIWHGENLLGVALGILRAALRASATPRPPAPTKPGATPNGKQKKKATKKRRHADLAGDGDGDSDDDFQLARAMELSEAEEKVYAALPTLRNTQGATTLHLFSGEAERDDGLAAALRDLGYPVLELDNTKDPAHDLANPILQEAVILAVRHNLVAAVLIGTPCTSYTVAHDLDNEKGAWRTHEYPHGRPDLSDAAKAWLARQDELLEFSVQVMATAVESRTPAVLENPAPRDDRNLRSFWEERSHVVSAWHMPIMIALLERVGEKLRMVVAPQCAFGPGPHGKLFQKYTALLCTPGAADILESLQLVCRHKSGQHDPAHGTDEAGASNSNMAAAYPPLMYSAIALALASTRMRDPDLAVALERLRAALPTPHTHYAPTRTALAALETWPAGSRSTERKTALARAGSSDSEKTEEMLADEDGEDVTTRLKGALPAAAPLAPVLGAPQPQAQPPPPTAQHEDANTTDLSPSLPRPLEPVEQARGATVPSSQRGAGDGGDLPLLHFGHEKSILHDSVIIVPVRTGAITHGEPLALMPLHSGVFGIRESSHVRNGRREAAVAAAADVATEVGVHKDVCFLAGEVDATGNGFDDEGGFRTSVVVAPCDLDTLRAEIATSPHDVAKLRAEWATRDPGREPQVWMTLSALADACQSADTTSRYRAAATAIAMAEAHVQPTAAAPAYIRSGARARRHAQAPTSKAEPGAISLSERMRRADAASEELHTALLAQDASTDPAFAEFCLGLAEQVGNCGTDQVPDELMGTTLPKPPDDLLLRPFKHRAQVLKVTPKPQPAAQEPPPDGWWPNSIEDIIMPDPLRKIRDWLRRCALWHKRGGSDKERPAAEAYGEDAMYPKARGRMLDLRGGVGHVRLWRDYTPEERQERTCINLAFAKELFADCADEEFVEFLTSGVRFHAGLTHQIVLMPNLLSLYRDGGVGAAAAQADDMVRLGFIAVFDDLPSVPYRVIPRGVVPKSGTDELRGIADQGAPRKPLHTTSESRHSEKVEALNDRCRAGDWDHEDKDTLEHAAFNGAILQALADTIGEVTIEIALDMSKWFHRMFYHAMDLWTTGAIIPSEATGTTKLAIEMAMTMGAMPASQIAQRFANALTQKVCIEMDHLELKARAASPLHPDLQHHLDERSRLIQADSYSVQGRLYDLTYYSDDGHCMVVGAQRAVRFLRAFWTIAGPDGLRAPLSRASKQQIGVCVIWLGGGLAAGLGLVWVPREKAARAALGLRTAIAGKMEVGDYRRLVGFLVSVLFMLGGDKTLLSHIFRPVKPGQELSSGPATLVWVDDLMHPTLERWSNLILNSPGAAAMCAVAPRPPDATSPRHRIRTDAALQGTPRPGLGGCMYGLWWALPIADCPGLETLDIPHLELLAACIGVLTYAEFLEQAEHIDLDTDALATAIALQNRARRPAQQAILDALMLSPLYQAVAPRLGVSHLFGAGNILGDAASRGYDETLQAVASALGVATKRIPISDEAQRFLRVALDKLAALRPGAGMGSTALGRSNLNLIGDMPVAHGGAGASPGGSPPASPLQHYAPSPPRHARPPQPRHSGGSGAGTPPWEHTTTAEEAQEGPPAPRRHRRTQYADGPHRRTVRTPPSKEPAAQRCRTTQSYAQAVSPTATPPPQEPTQHAAREPEPRGAARHRHRQTGTSLHDRLKSASDPWTAIEEHNLAHLHSFTRGKSTAPGQEPPPASGKSGEAPHSPSPHSPPAAPLQRGPRPPEGAAAAVLPPAASRRARAVSELDVARDNMRDKLYDKIRADTSEHALRADDDMLRWMCEVSVGDPDDTPVNTQSNLRSNWRHWEKFCAAVGQHVDPWRPNVEELDAVGVERERVLWTAGLIWIYQFSMKPKPGNFIRFGKFAGHLQPCHPKNALAIMRGIRKEHLDRGFTPPSLTLATRRMHEMTRRYARWIGPENLAPRKKTTLTHTIIVAMLATKEGARVPIRRSSVGGRAATTEDIDGESRATNKGGWSWRSQFGVSCRTLIHTLAQTGFRKAEVTLGNEDWGNMNISFANLAWRFTRDGRTYETSAPTAWELFNIKEGDFAIIRPPPSKCDQFAMRWGNSPIWLPYSKSAAINAARELAKWEAVSRVAPGARGDTPLFCGTGGVGTPLSEGACDDMFYGLLAIALGDKEAAKDYSVHSFRSFLASSMLAADCSDAQIQATLRWASAEALKEYKQVNAEVYGSWILRSELVHTTGPGLTGLRPHQLPRPKPAHDLTRPAPQTDDLLRHQIIHSWRQECFHDAAVADNDHGSPQLAEVIEGRPEPNWNGRAALEAQRAGRVRGAARKTVVAWATPARQ